uniref:Uncharacterized protein n=1 Tax=Anguilla anguilla TaxID=7936 RepID=A0A0E9QTG0_ANGAN
MFSFDFNWKCAACQHQRILNFYGTIFSIR